MKLRNSLLLLALAAALAAGPAFAADALDAVVQQKLVDKLGDDAKTIKVALVDKKVVLVGEVAGRATQELATEVAKSVPGVTHVDNQIKAKAEKGLASGKIQDEAADNKVESAVETLLKKELGNHAKGIEVENVGGTVSVRGTVPDDARLKIARDAVKGVPGVKKFIDLLEVAKK